MKQHWILPYSGWKIGCSKCSFGPIKFGLYFASISIITGEIFLLNKNKFLLWIFWIKHILCANIDFFCIMCDNEYCDCSHRINLLLVAQHWIQPKFDGSKTAFSASNFSPRIRQNLMLFHKIKVMQTIQGYNFFFIHEGHLGSRSPVISVFWLPIERTSYYRTCRYQYCVSKVEPIPYEFLGCWRLPYIN